MRRRVAFLLAVLAVALTFTGASGHVTARHTYLGVFAQQPLPTYLTTAVFYGQDHRVREGGRFISSIVGGIVELKCFALVKNVDQGHVFRAYARTVYQARWGFEITDTATVDTLKIYRSSGLTNSSTCKFGVSPNPVFPVTFVGASAAVG